MNNFDRTTLYRVMGPLLGLLAFVVYAMTLSPCAYPFESAYYIVHYSGIAPKLTVENPVFHMVTRLIATAGSTGSLSFRLNIFSALCSAASIFLLFQILSRFVFSVIEINRIGLPRARVAAISAGVVSSLTLLFSSHFWMVSNRFHLASFHVFLLLAMLRFFMQCLDKGSKKRLMFFAFIYGICIVEYPPFIPFLFLLAPYLIFWLWSREDLDTRIIIKLSAGGLFGLCFYFVAAGIFCLSDVFELMPQMSYLHVLWDLCLYQYLFLSRILPEFGWLIVVMLTVVPWLVCLFLAMRALNEDPNISLFIMHLMITVLAVIGVLNLEFLREPIEDARLYLVLPYVMIASLFGYLAAYWYLLPGCISSETENRFLLKLRGHLGLFLLLPFTAIILSLSVLNYPSANARSATFMKQYCEAVVESMEGAEWLLMNGGIENSIQIRAHELKKDIKVINLARFHNDTYLRYIGSLFERPLLKKYIEVGVMPMLTEWISTEEDAVDKIAVLNNPDLWRGLGFEPKPSAMVFTGVRTVPAQDELQLLFNRHVAFWGKNSELLLLDTEKMNTFTKAIYGNCMRHLGLVANNLGVLMEDGGLQQNAFEAYQKAREIDPDNVSALLNQSLMMQRGFAVEQKAEITAEMNKLEQQERKRGIWMLNRMYGYVRHPDVFARQGYVWALSGRPDMAISGLKRAESLVPEHSRSQVKNLLANIHMMSGQTELSKVVYEEVLDKKPDDHTALMGLTRLALIKGDVEDAKIFLERAEQAGVSVYERNRAWAVIALMTGDVDRARVIIEDLLSSDPSSLSASVLLAETLRIQGDDDALDECLKSMEQMPGGLVVVLNIKGEHAFRQNDISVATEYWEKALNRMPNNVRLLRKLLELDMRTHNMGNARRRARHLLNISPDDSLANHVIAGLMLRKQQYEPAEAALRKSIKTHLTIDAMNDLSWTLLQQRKLDEAEGVVRDALKLTAENYAVWDTLGEIMMVRERLDDAEKAFLQSLSITRKDPRVIMHMAELQIKKGNKQRASELLDEVFPKIKLLPDSEQRRLVELRKLAR